MLKQENGVVVGTWYNFGDIRFEVIHYFYFYHIPPPTPTNNVQIIHIYSQDICLLLSDTSSALTEPESQREHRDNLG